MKKPKIYLAENNIGYSIIADIDTDGMSIEFKENEEYDAEQTKFFIQKIIDALFEKKPFGDETQLDIVRAENVVIARFSDGYNPRQFVLTENFADDDIADMVTIFLNSLLELMEEEEVDDDEPVKSEVKNGQSKN